MLRKIHLPWGSGIGTLGFRFDDRYIDFSIVNGRLQMYRADFVIDELDRAHQTNRSWYQLTRQGWKLVRREDLWGELSASGRRRPRLSERPADPLQRAIAARKYFPLYEEIDWYGEKLEVISFPCPEKNRMTIMLRQFNEPGTLREVVLEEYL